MTYGVADLIDALQVTHMVSGSHSRGSMDNLEWCNCKWLTAPGRCVTLKPGKTCGHTLQPRNVGYGQSHPDARDDDDETTFSSTYSSVTQILRSISHRGMFLTGTCILWCVFKATFPAGGKSNVGGASSHISPAARWRSKKPNSVVVYHQELVLASRGEPHSYPCPLETLPLFLSEIYVCIYLSETIQLLTRMKNEWLAMCWAL